MEAGPWVKLGLKGANKIIDKHFDKIPPKYLYTDAYKPKALKRRSNRKNSQDQGNSQSEDEDSADDQPRGDRNKERTRRWIEEESDTEEYLQSHSHSRDPDIVLGQNNNQTMSPNYISRDGSLPGGAYSQESPYIQPPFQIYSHEPPRSRPQYMPENTKAPIGVAGGYYPPPPFNDEGEYYSDGHRQNRQRRPRMVTRRSSSYHGPRDRRDRRRDRYDSSDSDEDEDDRGRDDKSYAALTTRRGKTPSGSEHVDKARDRAARYGIKDEIEQSFTKSKAGLGSAAVGAAVAGWAANKAQIGYSKEGGKRDPNPLVTLLGAAVGGLAINAIVEKYEEATQGGGEKQEGTRSEGAKSRRGGDRERGRDGGSETGRSQKSRRRRDSAYGGSDGYD